MSERQQRVLELYPDLNELLADIGMREICLRQRYYTHADTPEKDPLKRREEDRFFVLPLEVQPPKE